MLTGFITPDALRVPGLEKTATTTTATSQKKGLLGALVVAHSEKSLKASVR